MSKIKIVCASDLHKAITMAEAIEAMREVYSLHDASLIELLDRVILNRKEEGAYALLMPSYVEKMGALSVKISTITPRNANIGLPLIDAVVVFVNPTTGQIEMLIDGKSLTAMRTGAMCGLATSLLSPVNARSMAIIGAGVQSRTIIKAICEVRNIEYIKIFSRTKDLSIKLKNDIENLYNLIKVDVVDNANNAVADVDIINTCTSNNSTTPVFSNCLLKNGVHINAIGGASINAVEIPIELYKNSISIVEDVASAKKESGEIQSALCRNYIKEDNLIGIGAIINKRIFIDKNRGISIFRSVGMAIQDTAIAAKIYEKSHGQAFKPINLS